MQQGRSGRQSFTRYHASYGSTPSSRYSRSVALYHARPQRGRVVDKLPRLDRFAGHRVFATRRSAEAPHRSPVRLMALAAIVVLVIALVVLLGNSSGSNVNADAYGNGSGVAQSTPRSEWRAGEAPYLYQIDPEWAEGSYAGSTIAESGCGPTCLSMVYVYLTGRTNMDPADMAAFSESHNYVDSGMTSWAFMDEGARVLGLRSRELPADYQSVRKALDAGYPVIASVSKGDFTTQGHFIVLAGTDEDGKVIVHDPNSVERSAKVWDLNRILSQTRNLWAFSV